MPQAVAPRRFADPTRVQFDSTITVGELEELVANRNIKVLQCAAPVSESVWILLNSSFFAARPDVELRIYGHYSDECDLKVARHMTNVRHFAADCLMRAQNIGCITEIPELESLSVGIFEMRDFEFLQQVTPTLKTLYLGATRSRSPTLAPLNRFRLLRTLYIEGHEKDIDVLRDLLQLEDLTLRSITTPDVSYLTPLTKLRSLDIKLGGIRSFAGVEGKASIKYLELWQIRELRDVGIISELPGLQNLFLQSLPHIKSFPTVAQATALRRVVLQNLRRLCDLQALQEAPALEEFALLEGKSQTPEQILPVLRNPATQALEAFFGSDRKNLAFAHLRDQHQKQPFKSPWPTFDYR